jgi:hypothetical protein
LRPGGSEGLDNFFQTGRQAKRVGDVQQFGAIFAKIKARFDERDTDGLMCKQGFYRHCSVLKLHKSSWTNDPMDRLQNKTGIFFSIWIDEKAASKSRANYNIHALKLRQLEGYAITSRNFADDFRHAFARKRDAWPNLSVDYGPLTLMQGWIGIDPKRFEEDTLVLLERFKPVSRLIDHLLDSRRK